MTSRREPGSESYRPATPVTCSQTLNLESGALPVSRQVLSTPRRQRQDRVPRSPKPVVVRPVLEASALESPHGFHTPRAQQGLRTASASPETRFRPGEPPPSTATGPGGQTGTPR